MPQLFALALALGGVAALHAAAVSRDLDADGPLYLLVAASHHGLALFEPARKVVHLLQQSFSCAAFRLGVSDLGTLARLMTLGMQGWPIVLTAGCWFLLPRGQKGWILGPLVNLAAVVPLVSFVGIHEAILASCMLWLLFIAVEFGNSSRLAPLAAAPLAAAGLALYEAAFPFLLGIALLALSRARETRGWRRPVFALVVPLALGGAARSFFWTVHPRDPANRGEFLHGVLGGFLVVGKPYAAGINLLPVAALAVAVCLLLVHLPGRVPDARRARVLTAACGLSLVLFALVAALFLAVPRWAAFPDGFGDSRWLPIAATTAMALATHLLRRAGWSPERLAPAPVRVVLAGVIAMHFLVQTALSVQWAAFQRDVAALVASRTGPIAWPEARAVLDPRHEHLRGAFAWSWNIQALSIVLAPAGRVQAAVDAPLGVRWRPYRLEDPTTLPLSARGLEWSAYLESIARGNAPPATRTP